MASTQPSTYTAPVFTCPFCDAEVEATIHVAVEVKLDRDEVTRDTPLAVAAKADVKVRKMTLSHDCEVAGIAETAKTAARLAYGYRGGV